MELLPRLFISMAVVLVLMWVAARVMKDRRLPGVGSAETRAEAKKNAVEVLGRQGVGKGATVTVIRAGGKTLLLGVTDAQISLLSELDAERPTALTVVPDVIDTHGTGVSAPASLPTTEEAWKGLLEQVRERTVRRA